MTSKETINSDSKSISTVFKKYIEIINDLNHVWEGTSKDNAVTKANEFVAEYSPILESQMSSLAAAAALAEQYLPIKQNIIKYEELYKQTTNDLTKQELLLEINTLISKLKNLKAKIEELIIDIVSKKLASAQFSSEEIGVLLEETEKAKKLGEKENLNDYYGDGYIEQELAIIKEKYSGREAAVQSALTLIKLAAEKGVRLDYDFGGAHDGDGSSVTTAEVLEGVDCSTFVCFLLNQGSEEKIVDMTTATLKSKYSKLAIDYADAKPGDIINRYNAAKESGHVEMIIENNPEEGYFITAEANSSNVGIKLSKTSYKECKKQGQLAYNMDSVYTS